MKTKKRLLFCALGITSLWILYVLFYTNPFSHLSLHARALRSSPSQLPRLVFSVNQWRNCFIPTDTLDLCSINATQRPKCPLEELAQDCALLKHLHGYEKPVNEEELNFPLAFGIKMHTAPEQAEQLLRAIYRPHNVYCFHIDMKARDKVYRVMASIAACFPNVFLSPRISYVYSSFDNVRSELRTMACALESSVKWKYYINMAGQEFPLKTNLEIVRILQILNGTNDIESFPLPKGERRRFAHSFNISHGQIHKTSAVKGPPPFKVPIRKGSQYNTFSRGFVTALFYDDDAISIMEYFRDGFCPEENVWSTINYVPWIPGGYQVHVAHSPKNEHITTAVAWQGTDPYKCKGKYIRKVCIFTQADLPWLLHLPNFFANKFRFEVDSRPTVCLEAVLDQRVRSQVSNINRSYYENLPHVRYSMKSRFGPSVTQ